MGSVTDEVFPFVVPGPYFPRETDVAVSQLDDFLTCEAARDQNCLCIKLVAVRLPAFDCAIQAAEKRSGGMRFREEAILDSNEQRTNSMSSLEAVL